MYFLFYIGDDFVMVYFPQNVEILLHFFQNFLDRQATASISWNRTKFYIQKVHTVRKNANVSCMYAANYYK